MGGNLCDNTNWILKTVQGTVRATGQAFGLAVARARELWLDLTALLEQEKTVVMDLPLSLMGLFGEEAIASFVIGNDCKGSIRDGERFD